MTTRSAPPVCRERTRDQIGGGLERGEVGDDGRHDACAAALGHRCKLVGAAPNEHETIAACGVHARQLGRDGRGGAEDEHAFHDVTHIATTVATRALCGSDASVMRCSSMVFFCALLVSAPAHADAVASAEHSIDHYYDEWLKVHPLAATELGIHAYDRELPDVSATADAAWVGRLKFWRAAITSSSSKAECDHACRIDARTVVFYIERELFDLEKLHSHARYPDTYTTIATEAVFPLVKRSFGTPSERAAAVVARLRAVPAMLLEGRKQLRAELVSPISITIALEELDGAISFIRDDAPRAFGMLPEAEQLGVRGAAAGAARALAGYGAFGSTKSSCPRRRAWSPSAPPCSPTSSRTTNKARSRSTRSSRAAKRSCIACSARSSSSRSRWIRRRPRCK